MNPRIFFGELVGTFLLVGIGCSSVALSIIYGWSLVVVVTCWMLAVFIGITVAHPFCGAHLNPAVSLAFLQLKAMSFKEFVGAVGGQLLGAFAAGWLVWMLFGEALVMKNAAHAFGEYFPNPDFSSENLSVWHAATMEAVGTFLLMTAILYISRSRLNKWIQFVLIGVVLAILIYFIAPYTQAGFNPARDFGPRVVSWLTAWREVAFRQGMNVFYVYILSPLVGGWLAAWLYLYHRHQKGLPNEFCKAQ